MCEKMASLGTKDNNTIAQQNLTGKFWVEFIEENKIGDCFIWPNEKPEKNPTSVHWGENMFVAEFFVPLIFHVPSKTLFSHTLFDRTSQKLWSGSKKKTFFFGSRFVVFFDESSSSVCYIYVSVYAMWTNKKKIDVVLDYATKDIRQKSNK